MSFVPRGDDILFWGWEVQLRKQYQKSIKAFFHIILKNVQNGKICLVVVVVVVVSFISVFGYKL